MLDVDVEPELEPLTETITENGNYNYTPDTDGFESVDITVDVKPFVTPFKVYLSENGKYHYESHYELGGGWDGFSSLDIKVNVPSSGGGNIDFSSIYDSQTCSGVEQMINDDIEYTKSAECPVPYTDLDEYYYGSRELVYAPLYNTDGSIFGTNCTTMSSLFYNCTSLQYVPKINTSSVTNMSYMFQKCVGLRYVPMIDTSSVTNMSYMFDDCSSLTEIPPLDTSNVTIM
jgi:surface protein